MRNQLYPEEFSTNRHEESGGDLLTSGSHEGLPHSQEEENPARYFSKSLPNERVGQKN